MDTTTILEIIEIINHRISNLRRGPLDGMPDNFTIGEQSSLEELRDHLQSFIESQLDAAENQSTEQ